MYLNTSTLVVGKLRFWKKAAPQLCNCRKEPRDWFPEPSHGSPYLSEIPCSVVQLPISTPPVFK